MNFSEHLRQSENKKSKVLLEHYLWGKQKIIIDELHIIDDERVGVIFKGQELFIYKNNIQDFGVDGDKLWVTDGRLTIIVNKL